MVGRHAFHTFDIVYKIYNPYLLVMVGKEHRQMLSFVVINLIVLAYLHFRLLVCTYILAGNNDIFQ